MGFAVAPVSLLCNPLNGRDSPHPASSLDLDDRLDHTIARDYAVSLEASVQPQSGSYFCTAPQLPPQFTKGNLGRITFVIKLAKQG